MKNKKKIVMSGIVGILVISIGLLFQGRNFINDNSTKGKTSESSITKKHVQQDVDVSEMSGVETENTFISDNTPKKNNDNKNQNHTEDSIDISKLFDDLKSMTSEETTEKKKNERDKIIETNVDETIENENQGQNKTQKDASDTLGVEQDAEKGYGGLIRGK